MNNLKAQDILDNNPDLKLWVTKHGKKDGFDIDRLSHAIRLSQELDKDFRLTFIQLIKMENKGLITLQNRLYQATNSPEPNPSENLVNITSTQE